MKRIIAFALALAVVFGVSFALYKPERIEAAARETMEDEWVGYFFALEPFDGRRYATETGDDYDFGVPGVPMFVTITDILPGEPGYVENDDFNHVIGAAVGDEAVGSGMHIKVDDNGSSYETGGEIVLDAQKRVELYECYVYRTPAGDYYAECVLYNGMKSAYCGPGFGLKQTRTISAERSGDWSVSGKTQSHSIKVSVSFVERTAAERLVFAWLRGGQEHSFARGIRRGRASRDADRAGRRGDPCCDADECGRHKRPLALHAGRSVRQSLCALDAFWPPACRRCVARLGREWDLTNS